MAHRVVVTSVLIVVFLGVGLGVFKLLASFAEAPEKSEREAPRTVVRVQVAERGTYPETLAGYGQATAVRGADIGAEVPGVIVWLSPKLEAGAQVEGPRLVDGLVPEDAPPGEVLVRLDDRDLRRAAEDATARREQADAAHDRAEAGLASVRKRLTVAKRDWATSTEELKRVQSLYETKTATASELDRQRLETALRERAVIDLEGQEAIAVADIGRARADRTAAVARETRAAQDVTRTVIRAPYRGRIESRRVNYRDRVGPGTVLFRIVDPTRVEIAVALGGSRFGEFAVGSKATVHRSEDGPAIWEGAVARVSSTVDPADRTCRAYLVIAGENGGASPVPPGSFVIARVNGLEHENVIAVPRTAFVGDRLYVAIPEASKERGALVEERTPSVYRWLSDVALVDGGVEPGERIVVTNLEELGNGSHVTLADEVPEDAGARER